MRKIFNALISAIIALIIALFLLSWLGSTISTHSFVGAVLGILLMFVPVWTLLLLGAFVVRLFMQRYLKALVIMLLLVVAFPFWRNSFVMHWFPSKNSEKKQIKVLTYNVEGCYEVKSRDLVDYFKETDADVVCLQEFYMRQQSIREIDGALRSLYPYCAHKGNSEIIVYSRYPLIGTSDIHFDEGYASALLTHLLVDGDTMALVNMHLESYKFSQTDRTIVQQALSDIKSDDMKSSSRSVGKKMYHALKKRASQVDCLTEVLDGEDHPIVLVGDMNDVATSNAFRRLAKNKRSAQSRAGSWFYWYTYHRHGMLVGIDHIIVDKSINVHDCQIEKVFFSDHLPVIATISAK